MNILPSDTLFNIIIMFLDNLHRPVLFKTHNVSETGFCLRLQVESTQLGPIDRASPSLRTLAPTQDRIYKRSGA
jgi:hypothetical protein